MLGGWRSRVMVFQNWLSYKAMWVTKVPLWVILKEGFCQGPSRISTRTDFLKRLKLNEGNRKRVDRLNGSVKKVPIIHVFQDRRWKGPGRKGPSGRLLFTNSQWAPALCWLLLQVSWPNWRVKSCLWEPHVDIQHRVQLGTEVWGNKK